ncbi:hypothetical protein QJQ45_029745 [Haematococcus lacustris]|nr:hypothetical protein QJQ45_029745 [Haematococcus lacustris]
MPAHSFASDVAAALLTSSTYTVVFYPIHRVKTVLQTQDSNPEFKSGRLPKFRFTTSFARITREQGVSSLWRGCLPYMLRHVPSTTLSFAFKDGVQRALPDLDPRTQRAAFVASRLLSGGLAGVAALAVVYPLEYTTIRLAAHVGPRGPGMMAVLAGSGRLGLRELYRGFAVSALAIGGYKALYFGLYDVAKAYMALPLPTPPSLPNCEGEQPAGLPSSPTAFSADPHTPPCPPPHPQDPSNWPNSLQPAPDATPASLLRGQAAAAGPSAAALPSPAAPSPSNPDSAPSPSPRHQKPPGDSLSTVAERAGGRWAAAGPPPQPPSAHPADLQPSQPGVADLCRSSPAPTRAAPPSLLLSWAVASGVVYVATTLTYPLDVVRKRLVVDASAPPGQRQYAGAWDCARQVAAREGLRGFYRFYGYDMLLRFGGGLLLVLYDQVKGGLAAPHHAAADPDP